VTGEPPGVGTPFLDQLVDWRKFEDFVREVHDLDPNAVAERNVTEVGRSGAKRQIDVKLTQVLDGETQVTLIECKRWKEKVDRARVDVLAASIEDLGADRGVMFTTTGYEPGAEAYAKHKEIEIFVVRDLTDEEWGQPGRLVWFYLHFYAGTPENLDFGPVELLHFGSETPPTNVALNLVIGKDQPHDPSQILYSVRDGSPGPSLVSVVVEARNRALDLLSRSIGAWDVDVEGETKGFRIPIELDLTAEPHRELRRSDGLIRLERLKLDLLATVSQSRFEFDRGSGFDLALAVENFVTRARRVVTRREDQKMEIYPIDDSRPAPDPDDPEILQNGILLKVVLEAWVTAPAVTAAAPTAAVAFRLPEWEASVTRPD
jgi:hypothetical protein